MIHVGHYPPISSFFTILVLQTAKKKRQTKHCGPDTCADCSVLYGACREIYSGPSRTSTAWQLCQSHSCQVKHPLLNHVFDANPSPATAATVTLHWKGIHNDILFGGCRKFLLLFGRIGPLALRPCALLRGWGFLPHSLNILQISL